MGRSKKENETELWLVPKRSSIHQTWCLIDAIISRKYDGRSWDTAKQNNLGVNLMRWGATRSGKNISLQSMRTLVALVQYLGFIYIDNTKTPSTINITKAGYWFWERNKGNIVKVKNLSDDVALLLDISAEVCLQMEKLQLTNPLQLKKCTNIHLFPFRMTLKILRELSYLDVEEIAMYLLHMKRGDEYEYVCEQIRNFRLLPIEKRKKLVDDYKQTDLGNITLTQASSASYFQSLCYSTGIVEVSVMTPLNYDKGLRVLTLVNDMLSEVETILSDKYVGVEPFDFGSDLRLWIQYFGDYEQLSTPVLFSICNDSEAERFIEVLDESGAQIYCDTVSVAENLIVPLFENRNYQVVEYSIESSSEINRYSIVPTATSLEVRLSAKHSEIKAKAASAEEIISQIREHISCDNFAGSMLRKLELLMRVEGVDKRDDKSLRGAYLEYLFYQLLSLLKEDGVIEDVVWNGKIGRYGLPTAAPGGVQGNYDILFIVDGVHFVLELTTMKSKSAQERAEAASVPGHIKIYKEHIDSVQVQGVYAAPILHSRVTDLMLGAAKHCKIQLGCHTIDSLLNILCSGSTLDIAEALTTKIE